MTDTFIYELSSRTGVEPVIIQRSLKTIKKIVSLILKNSIPVENGMDFVITKSTKTSFYFKVRLDVEKIYISFFKSTKYTTTEYKKLYPKRPCLNTTTIQLQKLLGGGFILHPDFNDIHIETINRLCELLSSNYQ